MKVELSVDVFTGDGFESIITLMRHFIDSRHEWVISPLHVDFVVQYLGRHSPSRVDIYAELARKGSAGNAWSVQRPGDPPVLTITRESLSDHVHDLSKPARFVVENQEGDGAFVLAVAYVFGAAEIVEAHEKQWLEFVQGGGSGEIPKVVRNAHKTFRRKARVSFLFDSDRLTPGESSKHEKAVAELSELGVSGHVLRFREAENYVPNKVLATRAPKAKAKLAAKLKHLKTLVPEQRAHFDIKNGILGQEAKVCLHPARAGGTLPVTTGAHEGGVAGGLRGRPHPGPQA